MKKTEKKIDWVLAGYVKENKNKALLAIFYDV